MTITGIVTDNLSGVAGLDVSVDGGNYAPLSFDPATGDFSFTSQLATNGSADGSHTIDFEATDFAGNSTAADAFTFVLETQAPVISLFSPSASGTLAAGATLDRKRDDQRRGARHAELRIWQRTGHSGGLCFRRIIQPGARPLSACAGSGITLFVTAMDAAGNTTSRTLNLEQPAAIPLQVVSLTPATGSTDVGVTFRPTVTFSRPIDTATLSSSNFYRDGLDRRVHSGLGRGVRRWHVCLAVLHQSDAGRLADFDHGERLDDQGGRRRAARRP